jgi:hypothetical protein
MRLNIFSRLNTWNQILLNNLNRSVTTVRVWIWLRVREGFGYGSGLGYGQALNNLKFMFSTTTLQECYCLYHYNNIEALNWPGIL